jgi:hypothetical protein
VVSAREVAEVTKVVSDFFLSNLISRKPSRNLAASPSRGNEKVYELYVRLLLAAEISALNPGEGEV